MGLYTWQKNEIDRFSMVEKRAIFAAPRIGKTRVSAELLKLWNVKVSLVTAPLSVCPAWVREIESVGLPVIIGYKGSITSILSAIQHGVSGVLIINDDRLKDLEHMLLTVVKPEAVIGDESHRFRGVSTLKAKIFRKLAWQAKYVRILSGTPAPNHYGDLWGQMVCISKEDFFPYFKHFAERYLIRAGEYNAVVGHINTEELLAKIRKHASVIRREDVFGEDQWQTVVREVELPPKAARVYHDLATKWIHESEIGEISTDHVLTRLMRMQQIASGFMRTTDGAFKHLHTEKIDAVISDLGEILDSGEKAVIFHKFSWEAQAYEYAIQKHFGFKPLSINGDTSPSKRQEAIDQINESPEPTVIIVQTQAGGTGISLAGATHALFVSQLFNFDDEQQARDRIFAPGKSRCVTYYRASRTVDAYIAASLAQKKKIHDSVVSANLQDVLYGG